MAEDRLGGGGPMLASGGLTYVVVMGSMTLD